MPDNPPFFEASLAAGLPLGGGSASSESLSFVAGGGDMGERIRAFDWAATPIGPLAGWPQSLKTAVRIMLTSRQPIWIGWGKDLLYLYNDPYKSIIAGKHPWALARPTKEVWHEIWHQIGPMLAIAMRGDEGTYVEAQLLIMERSGYPEETYYTYSYSPIPDDQGQPGGIICANTDDKQRVIGERQLGLLRELAAAGSESRTLSQLHERTARALATNQHDLPFALIYLAEPGGKSLSLVGWTPLGQPHAAFPRQVAIDEASSWPFAEVIGEQAVRVIDNLETRFGDALPRGAWDRSPKQAAVVPIPARGETGRQGVLIAGLSPFRQFDDGYRSFLGLAAGEIAANLADAQAYDDERRRAEALAEIDRAKTLFFSNISHEFRTPLTLMLSPLEEILSKPADRVLPENRALIEVAHRNSIRLLKLVNSLLDFSRIEAGRAQAAYEPTELASLTSDLASNFRSACERAVLRLVIDCPPLNALVYVDRDMWEKILLNLLSNAFKFTFEGEIAVRLREAQGHAELTVRDDGVGISAHELPRLFERFHRIEGQRSRTHEGSGIGLALVQELVKLHKGTISVDSAEGRGTCFTVAIPLGRAHLPSDRIGGARVASSTAVRADAYVDEALRWLPGDETGASERPVGDVAIKATSRSSERGRILLADDNADMRAYVRRLLAAQFDVQAVADGQAAIETIRERAPDLVLADVMMPRLDGIGLVRELRADPAFADLPVMLLSARAAEQARLQGLSAGADDYLVKPFSAHELIARVAANIKQAKLRQQASSIVIGQKHVLELVATGAPLQDVLDSLMAFVESQEPGLICGLLLTDDYGRFRLGSGPSLPPAYKQAVHELIQTVPNTSPYMATCCEAVQFDRPVLVVDVATEEQYPQAWRELMLASGLKAARSTPVHGTDGRILGCLALYFPEPRQPVPADERLVATASQLAAVAIEREHSRQALQYRTHQFETLLDRAPIGVYLVDSEFRIREANPSALAGFGIAGGVVGRDFDEVIHTMWPARHADEIVDIFRHTLASGEPFSTPRQSEVRADRGVMEHYDWRVDRITLPDGSFGAVCYFRDVGGQVAAEDTRQLLLHELNHRVKNTLAGVQAIAQQTMRNTKEPEEFAKRFSGRIQSLSRVHSLLTDSTWLGADLRELIRDQLLHGPVDEARLTAGGPNVHLAPQMAMHLAVMVHELGTNSIKYGALSTREGRVGISWTITGEMLNLQWVERGGPMISAPSRRGFGTTLIEQSAVSEGGGAEPLFEPEGVTWKIRMQLPPSDIRKAVNEESQMTNSAPAARPVAEPAKLTAPLKGLRFLVVEDESLIAMDLVDVLGNFGADLAKPVYTQKACLELLEASSFDCALLDANLHGRSVDDIAAALTRRKIPFVFVTGYGRSGLPTAFQQAPVLSKPVSEEQLLEAVTALVSTSRLNA